ncbi:MAG: hypothetical protein ACU836_15120 [Gammaproteobacteria bacterium]
MPDKSDYIVNQREDRVALRLRDFLCDQQLSVVGEYLSLSITHFDDYLCIRLTATNPRDGSYTAIIPNAQTNDLDTVQFVMQSRGLFF